MMVFASANSNYKLCVCYQDDFDTKFTGNRTLTDMPRPTVFADRKSWKIKSGFQISLMLTSGLQYISKVVLYLAEASLPLFASRIP